MKNERALFKVAILVAAGLLVGCPSGDGKPPTGTPQADTPQADTPQADTPQADTPQAGVALATVKGKIKVTGDPLPGPELKLINKDPEVCGQGQREIHWYVAKDGLLHETVVFVEGAFAGASWEGSSASARLVQEGCFFKPYLAIWRKGKEVEIESKDAAAHNIHTYERVGAARRELFNFNQPNKDVRRVEIKPRRSPFVELTCDNHDFMVGWRFVAENPYCTVAEDGRYTLRLPAGSHTLKVWHPMLGVLDAEIEVKAGEENTLDFEFEYEE